jgi:hypothetical protein
LVRGPLDPARRRPHRGAVLSVRRPSPHSVGAGEWRGPAGCCNPAMRRPRLPDTKLWLWPLRRRSITPAAGLMSAGPWSTTGCRRCVGPALHRLRRVYPRRLRSTTGAAAPPSRRARSSTCSAASTSVGSGPPPGPPLLRPAAWLRAHLSARAHMLRPGVSELSGLASPTLLT